MLVKVQYNKTLNAKYKGISQIYNHGKDRDNVNDLPQTRQFFQACSKLDRNFQQQQAENQQSKFLSLNQDSLMYKETISIDPKPSYKLYRLALINYDTHQYSKAESNFIVALKLNPDNVQYKYGLSICYGKLGKIKEAICLLDECLVTSPRGRRFLHKKRIFKKMLAYKKQNFGKHLSNSSQSTHNGFQSQDEFQQIKQKQSSQNKDYGQDYNKQEQ